MTTAHRIELLGVVAWVALLQGDHSAAGEYLDAANAGLEGLDDPLLRAKIEVWDALHLLFGGELDEAAERFGWVIDVFWTAGEESMAQTALFMRAHAQTCAGDHRAALESCAAGLGISDRRGERRNRAYLLWA